MQLQYSSNLQSTLRISIFTMIISLLLSCTQYSAVNPNKNKIRYIPLIYQKKQDLKSIQRETFFKLYGEYSNNNSYNTDIYSCANHVYIDISLPQGCYVEKNTLSVYSGPSPKQGNDIPLHINKYHQTIKFYFYKKGSFISRPESDRYSYFFKAKIYGKQLSLRFPLRYLQKAENILSFDHAGECYASKKHKRLIRFYITNNIVYDVITKTLKLVKAKRPGYPEDPDDMF